MAAVVVGAASGNTGAGTVSTPIATAFHADWQPGDRALLFGHPSGAALALTPSAGWSAPAGPSWPVSEGSNSRLYAWTRELQSGDAPPTLTPSGAITCAWTMVVLRGVGGIAQVAVSSAAGSPLTLPTLPGVAAGSALVAAAHCRVASSTIPTVITLPGAYTKPVDHATSRPTANANIRAAAGHQVAAASGSYGGDLVTSDVTGSMLALLVELPALGTDAALTATLPALTGQIAAAAADDAAFTAALPALGARWWGQAGSSSGAAARIVTDTTGGRLTTDSAGRWM
ncbi:MULTISPECIES: hypothetical protein [Micromonospora]|uniref:hypothetical protein n=1 Tax=Micromonospora TaxID=1873 RepID=UPI0004C0E829|nr:hypothetical protein [Micromonospora sp. RV43]